MLLDNQIEKQIEALPEKMQQQEWFLQKEFVETAWRIFLCLRIYFVCLGSEVQGPKEFERGNKN